MSSQKKKNKIMEEVYDAVTTDAYNDGSFIECEVCKEDKGPHLFAKSDFVNNDGCFICRNCVP
jgi:hypothetical protein